VIRIYHTSDLHDRRGIAHRLRALKSEKPGLLFDCGDSLRGSQTVYHSSEPIMQELDAAGYDAQAIGNREFHYLFPALRARALRMRHPLICTNLRDTKGRRLPFRASLRLMPHGEPLIVLSHLGLSLDCELAARVPRIDLLLGGHSHDTLVAPRYVGEVPIVHAGPYGEFVSRSEMTYDARRERFALEDFALLPLLGSA
jgi:2',3'-cyclic-nucleotide 2'-phosphodiesterase (5'-nucleotidase family)